MQSRGSGGFVSDRQELYQLDRLLNQLARPMVAGAEVPPAVRSELRSLGLPFGRNSEREDLIQQVWGIKRPLVRELDTFDDSLPPCA